MWPVDRDDVFGLAYQRGNRTLCYFNPFEFFDPTPSQNKFLGTVSGHAVAADRMAAVYYDYLPRLTGTITGTSDTATILGCVIAHELGHLLLGAHGHSPAGIMKGQWDFEQTRPALMSGLCFLPEEAEVMQGLLREGK